MDGIFQPNAVIETTLMNNAALNVRSLMMRNKDKASLPMEQYVGAASDFCVRFGEHIVNSPNITEADLVLEKPPRLVIHLNQDLKCHYLVLIVVNLDNEKITDPMMCEMLHKWTESMMKAAGGKG